MPRNLIFGLRPVQEALASGHRINRILFAKESRNPGCRALQQEAKKRGVPFDIVPQAKLNALTETHEHQGVAARISPIEYAQLEQFLETCPEQTTVVLLDQVQHPKNLGLVIRTAAAAGAQGIVLTARKTALLDEAILRASTGALLRLPVMLSTQITRDLQMMKDAGFWIYGLHPAGNQPLFDTQWPGRVALIIGNESKGLSPKVEKVCDELIRIPLKNDMDSLNAAVAAGIVLYHLEWTRSR